MQVVSPDIKMVWSLTFVLRDGSFFPIRINYVQEKIERLYGKEWL